MEKNILSHESEFVFIIDNIETDNLKMEFVPSKRKKVKKIIINIEGNIGVSNIELIFEKLNQLKDEFTNVDIHLKRITQIDISGIQLLYFFIKQFEIENKSIFLNIDFTKEQKLFIGRLGYMGMLENGNVNKSNS